MKKFILILAVLFVWGNGAWADEAKKLEFVNPVFNQPLRPMSMRSGYEYLTPTTVDFRTPLDKNIKNAEGNCELLENEEDHIKMSCKLTWLLYDTKYKTYKEDFTSEEYYIYRIKGLSHEECLDIEALNYDEGQQEYNSELHFCVTPPDGYATKE
ncbi:MAG TPA: hypothetical protein DD619_01550 [Alphaproteobacteria bacterium]|nr:hypothetical protein [Alphaproteobacteria bacterium]